MQELLVDLGDRSYPIYIGADILSEKGLLQRYIKGQQILVVTNTTVAPIYLDSLLKSLAPMTPSVITLADGEQFKTLETLNSIFDQLLREKHSRTTTLIALGGGVVGDITGFAAACYQRGVSFIQVPTTLLAQVDSSVGGKTAVNHMLGKNMVGAFHQPQCVLADIRLLRTLAAREFSAGMAEVIKYGLIADESFLSWLEENMSNLMSQDEEALSYAIYRSCQVKADIVAQDETEQGVRALLNLGHTFGHAIETVMDYRGVLHGEAVAIGMCMAAEMSCLAGSLSNKDVERVKEVLTAAGLPLRPDKGLSLDAIKEAMQVDKKAVDKKLRLILLHKLGDAYVSSDFSAELLEETLNMAFG